MSQMGSYSRVRYLDCVFKSFVVVQACVKIHFSLNSTTPRLKKKSKEKEGEQRVFPRDINNHKTTAITRCGTALVLPHAAAYSGGSGVCWLQGRLHRVKCDTLFSFYICDLITNIH